MWHCVVNPFYELDWFLELLPFRFESLLALLPRSVMSGVLRSAQMFENLCE
jgi:hypothetical protein